MIKMRDLLKENFNLSEKVIDEIIDANIKSDQDHHTVKQFCINFIKKINNLPSTITLYRILNIEGKGELNKDRLGSHFVLKPYFNDNFLNSIGLRSADKDNLKIIQVKTSKSNVKIGRTLAQNIMFPGENEIFIQTNSTFFNIKILPYKGK